MKIINIKKSNFLSRKKILLMTLLLGQGAVASNFIGEEYLNQKNISSQLKSFMQWEYFGLQEILRGRSDSLFSHTISQHDKISSTFNWKMYGFKLQNRKNISEHIIFSLLLTPTNAKAYDFRFIKDDKFFSKAMGRGLGTSISYFINNEEKITGHRITLRSLSLCNERWMRWQISEEVRSHFLSLCPEEIILLWLKYLKDLDSEGHSFKTVEGTSLLVLNRLKILQTALINPYLSHDDLFKLLHPLAHLYYKKLRDKYRKPKEIAKYIFDKQQQPLLEKILPLMHRLSDGSFIFKALRDEKYPAVKNRSRQSLYFHEARKILGKNEISPANFIEESEAYIAYLKYKNHAFHYLLPFKNYRYDLKSQWEQTLNFLFTSDPSGLQVKTATLGEKFISSKVVSQLFGQDGRIKAYNKYGRRRVGHIVLQNQKIYIKEYPELPGLEQAVALFSYKLFGTGVPLGDLIRIKDKPYYISQGIEGPTLQEVFDSNSNYLSMLDPISTSASLILSFLIKPEDGKPDNYIIQPLPEGGYRLIGIDNDHAFGPIIVRDKEKLVPQVKSVLFCLEAMCSPIHPAVQKVIAFLDPASFLEDWLKELSSLNVAYIKLFNPQERRYFLERENSFINIAFTPHMISRLYESLVKLQYILQKEKSPTHFEILKYMEPLLYQRYKSVFEKEKNLSDKTTLQRFIQADGRLFGQDSAQGFVTTTNLKDFMTTLNIPLKETIYAGMKHNHDWGPETGLLELQSIVQEVDTKIVGKGINYFLQIKTDKRRQEFLQSLNFKSLTFVEQKAWINSLKQLVDPSILIIQNSTCLNLQDFQDGFSLFNLRKLDISGSGQLDDAFFILLSQQAPVLKILKASNLNTVQFFEDATKLGFIRVGKKPILFSFLKFLDLSYCSRLKLINLEAPSLTSLKLKGCEQLEDMNVKTPKLKILDIRRAWKLTDTLLDAQLRAMDFLKEFKLNGQAGNLYLTVQQDFPVYPLRLIAKTSFDIRNKAIIPLLKNTISYLNLNESLISLFQNIKVTFSGLETDSQFLYNIEALSEALKLNSSLAILRLKSNGIGKEATKILGNSISIPPLQELDLSCNIICSQAIQFLFPTLEKNKSLTILNLQRNRLEDGGAKFLASALESNIPLKELDLSHNNISGYGLQSLALSLENNDNLITLSLASNPLFKFYCNTPFHHLFNNRCLRSLNLRFTDLMDLGAEYIAYGIMVNKTLESLDVSFNNINERGIEALGKALEKNMSLTHLNLSENHAGPKGIISLAQGLGKHLFLKDLSLSDNKIGDEEVSILADALTINNSLTSLDLTSNPISNIGGEKLLQAFEINRSLTSLEIFNGTKVKKNINDKIFSFTERNKSFAKPQKIFKEEKREKIYRQDSQQTTKIEEKLEDSNLDHSSKDIFLPRQDSIFTFPEKIFLKTSIEQMEEEMFIPKSPLENDFFYAGLSIDGGGIRGRIPAGLLAQLELFSHKSIYDLFDCIGGTSIGGILALSLTATEDMHRPLWKAAELENFFETQGPIIFPRLNFIEKSYQTISQLWGPKYSIASLAKVLKRHFGNVALSNTLTPVIVTAMENGSGELKIFNSSHAQANMFEDYSIASLGAAISAAPTYFDAIPLQSIMKSPEQIFIDGGLICNNPSQLVYNEIVNLYQDISIQPLPLNIKLISLGTGQIKNPALIPKKAGIVRGVKPTIDSMMFSSSHEVHNNMKYILKDNYYRFQPILETPIDLADSSQQTLTTLENIVYTFDEDVEQLARMLAENSERRHALSW